MMIFKYVFVVISTLIIFQSVIAEIRLNEPTDIYYLAPLTLDRILFAIFGFLIFLNIELFNQIKSK